MSKRVEPIRSEALPRAVWKAAVPVRFGHCDPAGIVFTPRYFDILNESIERFFVERLGIDYYGLISSRRIGLGYAHASCEFRTPSRMGDVLDVAVLVERIGRSSYAFDLPVFRQAQEVARGRLVTVTTSLDDMRPRPIPEDVRAALEGYWADCGDGSRES